MGWRPCWTASKGSWRREVRSVHHRAKIPRNPGEAVPCRGSSYDLSLRRISQQRSLRGQERRKGSSAPMGIMPRHTRTGGEPHISADRGYADFVELRQGEVRRIPSTYWCENPVE